MLAGYYLIVGIARFSLIQRNRRCETIGDKKLQQKFENQTFRFSGYLLLVTTFFLQLTVYHIVKSGNGYRYDGNIIYVVACYDFYCLIKSLVYVFRKQKKHNLILQSIKRFSLATSLVALLSLQTAMFASFGSEFELVSQQKMNAITGIGISLVLLLISIQMIYQGTTKIRVINKTQTF